MRKPADQHRIPDKQSESGIGNSRGKYRQRSAIQPEKQDAPHSGAETRRQNPNHHKQINLHCATLAASMPETRELRICHTATTASERSHSLRRNRVNHRDRDRLTSTTMST